MNNSTLPQKIKQKRQHRNISLRMLAREVKCSPSNLSKIESGKNPNPSQALIESICRYLGIDRELTSEKGEVYKEDPIVAEIPVVYFKDRRDKIWCDVKKLLLTADEKTLDALETNVREFLRIPPKRKEEGEEE